jgi:hypothetical protein
MIGSGVNSDLLLFTRQFSAMVRSNLQLVHALESLARETPRRKLRNALNDVLSKVRAGRDFDRALADHPSIFNSTYVGVVRAGMQSGQLGEALQQVTEYLTSLDKVMKKIRSAMMYPLLLLVSFVGTFPHDGVRHSASFRDAVRRIQSCAAPCRHKSSWRWGTLMRPCGPSCWRRRCFRPSVSLPGSAPRQDG